MEQLINSGLSIKDALEISSLINKKNNTLEATLFEQIQKGVSFADSVQKLDNIFPPVYRGIISVGDKIGSVEKIFPRLRLYLETQKKIDEIYEFAPAEIAQPIFPYHNWCDITEDIIGGEMPEEWCKIYGDPTPEESEPVESWYFANLSDKAD